MVTCPNIDVDIKDEQTGTNAFWLAAFYGRGEVLAVLANVGANILIKHPETKSNALHVAIERKHFMVAKMLIQSKFPVNDVKKGGITPLILISRDKSKDAISVANSLIHNGANIDQVTELGQSALGASVINENRKLIDNLLKKGARMFNEDMETRDMSPFFVAMNEQKQWAVETFCDHGANIEMKTSTGMTPILYAATKGFDDVCMYLSLRSENADVEDQQGRTVLIIYLLKKNTERVKQLIMRGRNINHCGKSGLTPMMWAIKDNVPSKVIKFLLKNGSDPHIENFDGEDCCDMAKKNPRYKDIKVMFDPHEGCGRDPSLR